MITQCLPLSKIVVSIWSAFFVKTRQMYLTMIRLMMKYGSIIWHNSMNKFNEKTCDKLLIIQIKCWYSIADVFKVILMKMLKTKNFISFLNLHLNRLQAKTRMRFHDFDRTKQIRIACERMALWLRARHDKWAYIKFISDKRKIFWTTKLTQKFIIKCV